jgi:hypothetical protein
MSGALTILFSDNFRFGLYPQYELSDEQVLLSCGCDGQFSEADVCRLKGSYSFETLGYCSQLSPYTSSFYNYVQVWQPYEKFDASVICRHSATDRRPRFILLGGGLILVGVLRLRYKSSSCPV